MIDVSLDLALVSREGTNRDQMGNGSHEGCLTGEMQTGPDSQCLTYLFNVEAQHVLPLSLK